LSLSKCRDGICSRSLVQLMKASTGSRFDPGPIARDWLFDFTSQPAGYHQFNVISYEHMS
jgi:hypothetical protein